MRKFIAVICIICLLTLPFSCSALSEGLNIVCTSFPCYDFARAVCGDQANITMLIKPGAEVHSYEPTPSDIMALASCDLFIYIGGESDAWVEDILSSFGSGAPETLRLFDCVEAVVNEHEEDHHHVNEYDEHIWTSPVNAIKMVEAVTVRMGEIDPDGADIYRSKGASYIELIKGIDQSIRELVAQSVRKEIIFADRFPFIYLAKEYGLEYACAFPSCSAESEPSAKTMATLIQKVNADEIPVIYTIELSNGKTAKAISEETGAKILTLHSVQTVTEAEFSAGESYVSLMIKNVVALMEGLM